MSYEIVSGNKAAIFFIQSDSGELKLVNETSIILSGPHYTLNVSATDGIHRVYTYIQVNIKDINNHVPVFTNCSHYRPTLPENSPPNFPIIKVTAIDDDLGKNGNVEYALLNARKFFMIDPLTGDIKTAGSLDREKTPRLSIIVKAIDGDKNMKSEERLEGLCFFDVTITDVNDHRPTFESSSYLQTIKDNVEVGYEILKVIANDKDEGINADITYTLKKYSSLFLIHPQSGIIQTKVKLFNKKTTYMFKVLASDHGNPQLTSEVDVTVVVIKSKDQPHFMKNYYEKTIPENVTFPSVVYKVSAGSDNTDPPMYGIEYGNTPSTNSMRTFDIDPDGNIRVLQSLDRETIPIYTLTIYAETTSGLRSQTTFRVILEDVNDCAPVFFLSRYKGVVPENTAAPIEVLYVRAEDRDTTENIVYSMVKKNDYFQINSRTGVINTKTKFDRELKNTHVFQVKASDKDRPLLSSHVTVRVTISDKNDNSPAFENKYYKAFIEENSSLGTSVITVTALDKDSGLNAKITYSIKEGNEDGKFQINHEDGRVFVNGLLDYESKSEYKLLLGAWDGVHRNTTCLVVKIINVNDNNPKFELSPIRAFIKENMAVGSSLITLKANDPDAEWITYNLSSHMKNIFKINRNTGHITTKVVLDREFKESYMFQAYAHDHHGRTGAVNVLVKVLDENDNEPKFVETHIKLSVLENSPVGTVAGRVTATDLDDVNSDNGKVYYGIAYGYGFIIDNETGILKTTLAFDRENISTVALTVTASNAGIRPMMSFKNIVVYVMDMNDNEPQFYKDVYRATVAENASLGLNILRLNASDIDIGMNGLLRFV